MGKALASIDLSATACLILEPGEKKPRIIVLKSDGMGLEITFENKEKYDAAWDKHGEAIKQSFIQYDTLFFRDTYLQEFKSGHSEKDGHYVELVFIKNFRFHRAYLNEGSLAKDYVHLCKVLMFLQDRRTTCPLSSTVH